jgi:AcrR family transcriptional regulator
VVTARRTSTTSGRRGQGRTQAERRASSERKLLDAAARLIAERGTSSVSFADIAKAAGCSHGLPGYLFGSKTELLLALVDDVLVVLRTEMFEPAIGEERGLLAIREALRVFVESLARPTRYTRAMYVLFGEAAGSPPELRNALAGYQNDLRRIFRHMVVQGIERGEIRPDLDPEVQSVWILGVARGIGQQAVLDPTTLDIPAVAVAVAEMVTRALAVDGWVEPTSSSPHQSVP